MMTRQERAKQFMAFDALKGLQEALRDREERHLRVQKADLSDEIVERNSRVICKLRRGMKAEISCYSAFHNVVKRGIVTDVNITLKFLKLEDEKIWFDDIYAIRITDY